MNTRHIFTLDSLCDSRTTVPMERVPLNPNSRPPQNPLLIRLAMRISRSRWYSFMRRVFHYQNGSGPGLGPNPFDSKTWMMTEFASSVVQISLTAYTLSVSREERPVWPMRLWASGYAFGCFLTLIHLCFRYHLLHLTQCNTTNPDVENQRNHLESRYMQRFKTSLELLFAIWFVMGNVWVFDSRFSSYLHAPKLHTLCISLLAWNAVGYSFPFILFVLLCCCVPLFSSLLGYNMNTGSRQRGATEEQLSSLPTWKHGDGTDRVVVEIEIGNPTKNNQEDLECCICLAKYRDKEEIRQLPCTHNFHLDCVDQWLKIISCCPLCKQGIE